MIEKLVTGALRMPAIVLALTLALVAAGVYAYGQLDVEAYPNPVPPLVEVITQPNGSGAEEVERQYTVPLEIGLSGMPGLSEIRSQSLFGLSDIKCYFSWDTDYATARQEVINRLQFATLPQGTQAQISPWNGIGEIYRYTVDGPGYSVMDLKTAEDWSLERRFKQVPGVIDVVSFGGETKQYHVEVDPFRLRGQGTSLATVESALQNANRNVGGQRLTLGEQSYDVRGIGLMRNVHDIENVVVAESGGTPVRVQQIGTVSVGAAPRLGTVGRDDNNDVVQGTVLMRYGGETPSTLAGVHAAVDSIRKEQVLPPGVEIKPYYDRGELVHLTMHTVMENVGVGIALVSLVLLVFLGHVRAAIITSLTIPLALLIAFCGLVSTHTSANLLSLGAIDFGIVVDSTVIMVENIFRHLGSHGKGSMTDRVLAAAREVATPMAFSTVIIGVSFLPLFAMNGVSGVIFAPMARTYAFAIGGAILLALTLIPVLVVRFIPAHDEEKESPIMHLLHRVYSPFFEAALRRPKIAMMLMLVPVLACVALFPLLGREFMPKLEEGNLWIRATLPTSIALEESSQYVGRMRRIVRGCPDDAQANCDGKNRRHQQVIAAVSQLGRPDDGTDVTGFNNIEIFAPLKSFDDPAWAGETKEHLIDTLTKELHAAYPGVVFNFSQMISDNVEEAISGVKGENSIKVFGPDLATDEKLAQQIMAVMERVPGVQDLGMFHSLGQPNLRITPDRQKCARYGLNTGDVADVIQAAIGGLDVTEVYEGERYFDLTVRWANEHRKSIESIREITLSTPDGASVPLGQIAEVVAVDGPASIYRENSRRYVPIKFSVRGRDLAGTIADAEKRIAREIHLPYGVRLEWSGEINELKNAQSRLSIILPMTLLLITFLTYSAVRNWLDTMIVLVNVPVAATGGLLALIATGTHLSVSAAMGFISILGIAIQDAILVVTYYQRLRVEEGHTIVEAAREAAEKRFRPVLMTTLVATLGLLPAALSHGIGSQTQKPLAIVVIGGSLILAILTRVLQPPMLVVAHQWYEKFLGRTPRESATEEVA